MRRRSLIPFMAVAAAAPPATADAACEGANQPIVAQDPSAAARATRCVVNEQRRKVRNLRPQGTLAATAQRTAADLVRRRYWSHTTPEGRGPGWKMRKYRKGRRWFHVGENLAFEPGAAATPRAVVRAWMRSRTHRANVMARRFRELGIGIVRGTPRGGPGMTLVAHFGARG